jgi:hypothetical protein
MCTYNNNIFNGFSFTAHPASTQIQYTALNFKTKQYINNVSQLWDMTLLYSLMSEFLFYTFLICFIGLYFFGNQQQNICFLFDFSSLLFQWHSISITLFFFQSFRLGILITLFAIFGTCDIVLLFAYKKTINHYDNEIRYIISTVFVVVLFAVSVPAAPYNDK